MSMINMLGNLLLISGLVVVVSCGGGYGGSGSSTKPPPQQVPSGDFTLTLNSGAFGTLTASPPGGVYAPGTVVVLTANADANYIIDSWSGTDDDTSRATTNQVTMNANHVVSVTFALTGPG